MVADVVAAVVVVVVVVVAAESLEKKNKTKKYFHFGLTRKETLRVQRRIPLRQPRERYRGHQ